MINSVKRFFQKRVSDDVTEARSFVPLENSLFGETGNFKYTPIVQQVVDLYTQLLCSTPLTCTKEDHPLYKLLQKKPCPWMSRYNFFQLMCENLLLHSNFYCIVKGNGEGISGLLPYNNPESVTVWPSYYTQKKETDGNVIFDDPGELWNRDLVYKDFKGRVFTSDEFFHIKDLSLNKSNMLEGESKIKALSDAFNTAWENLKYLLCSAQAGYKANVILNGYGFVTSKGPGQPTKSSPKEMNQLRRDLIEYFTSRSRVLGTPPGYSVSRADYDDFHQLLNVAYNLALKEVCRVLGVPFSLVSGGLDERGQKEARRFFISGQFSGFSKQIAESFTDLTGGDAEFSFDLDKLRIASADLREEANFVQALSELYTAKQLKEKVELN